LNWITKSEFNGTLVEPSIRAVPVAQIASDVTPTDVAAPGYQIA
jgi:hypothetical protein